MNLRDHPFFLAVDMSVKIYKKVGVFGSGNVSRSDFFGTIKDAHPFVFDQTVTREKMSEGSKFKRFNKNLVRDFSLPRSCSLYLVNGSEASDITGPDEEKFSGNLLGCLIKETSPEKFIVFEVYNVVSGGQDVPFIRKFLIDLKALNFVSEASKVLNFKVFNEKTNVDILKKTSIIFSLTNCLSVKRIGIEKIKSFSLKSGDLGAGRVVMKSDNLIHVADKIEYEYRPRTEEDSKIQWQYGGYWRGHWRAFYCHDAKGDKIKDSFGRNIVDYGKSGKNRSGEYVVDGYTWVDEHVKGDPRLAEIKTHLVKRG